MMMKEERKAKQGNTFPKPLNIEQKTDETFCNREKSSFRFPKNLI